jgi:hypothetical protein
MVAALLVEVYVYILAYPPVNLAVLDHVQVVAQNVLQVARQLVVENADIHVRDLVLVIAPLHVLLVIVHVDAL